MPLEICLGVNFCVDYSIITINRNVFMISYFTFKISLTKIMGATIYIISFPGFIQKIPKLIIQRIFWQMQSKKSECWIFYCLNDIRMTSMKARLHLFLKTRSICWYQSWAFFQNRLQTQLLRIFNCESPLAEMIIAQYSVKET